MGGNLSREAYIFMGLQLGIGVCNSFLIKAQDEVKTSYGYFVHPYIQSLTMFFAEFICLFLFMLQLYIQMRITKNKRKSLRDINENINENINTVDLNENINTVDLNEDINTVDINSNNIERKAKALNWLWYSVPAGADCVASTIYFYGTYFTAASVVQMMGGLMVCVTCLYSSLFLKRKFYRHHYFGILLIVLGVIVVAVANVMESNDSKGSDETPTKLIGVIMLIVSYVIQPIQMVAEEKLFSTYDIQALQAVGYEGTFGMLYLLILLPILQFIPADRMRVDNRGHDLNLFGKAEDTVVAFVQLGESAVLLWLTIGMCASLACFNYVGQSVTKYASATSRTTIQAFRTVGIWIISLSLGWEHILWLQVFGFLLITLGVLIYNEVLVLPFWGLNSFTSNFTATFGSAASNASVASVEEHLDYHDSEEDAQ